MAVQVGSAVKPVTVNVRGAAWPMARGAPLAGADVPPLGAQARVTLTDAALLSEKSLWTTNVPCVELVRAQFVEVLV